MWFGNLPLGALASFTVYDLVAYVIADPPDGMNHDYNFEALWPGLLESMSADNPGGGSSLVELSRR